MSFTSVLPTPQIILKTKPAPPTDTAKGIDTLVSLTVYAAPKDTAKGAEAVSAFSVSIPPQLDTAKATDLPALAGPSLYGYILRLVKKGDIILPDDQNNLVYAWKAKIDKLSEIESKLRETSPSLADTLAAYIGELKSIVDSMPLVKEGDWVYSDHFNLHLRALRKLIEIEEWLTTEVQGSRSDMVQLLDAMKNYAGQLSEKATGDIVASADWNNLKQALGFAPRLDELASQLYYKIVVLVGDAPPHSAPSGLTLGIFTSAYGGDPGRDAVMFTDDDLDYAPVVQSLAQKGIRVFGVYYPHYTGSLGQDALANFQYVTSQTNGKLYYGGTSWHTQMVNDILALLPPGAAADIAFVVDVTGSMDVSIGDVKAKIKAVIDALPTDRAFRFGLASFRDYPGYYSSYGYSAQYGLTGDWPWRMHIDLTADRSAVKSAVDALVAYGGADDPECYTRALYESQFFSWRY
jgi:hypothetical protein